MKAANGDASYPNALDFAESNMDNRIRHCQSDFLDPRCSLQLDQVTEFLFGNRDAFAFARSRMARYRLPHLAGDALVRAYLKARTTLTRRQEPYPLEAWRPAPFAMRVLRCACADLAREESSDYGEPPGPPELDRNQRLENLVVGSDSAWDEFVASRQTARDRRWLDTAREVVTERYEEGCLKPLAAAVLLAELSRIEGGLALLDPDEAVLGGGIGIADQVLWQLLRRIDPEGFRVSDAATRQRKRRLKSALDEAAREVIIEVQRRLGEARGSDGR